MCQWPVTIFKKGPSTFQNRGQLLAYVFVNKLGRQLYNTVQDKQHVFHLFEIFSRTIWLSGFIVLIVLIIIYVHVLLHWQNLSPIQKKLLILFNLLSLFAPGKKNLATLLSQLSGLLCI